MLVIRLFRTGKINQPFFKIVVIDKRRPAKGGRFVEEVGFLNTLKKEKKLKADRIKYWLSKGAKPSDTIYNLLVKEKILQGKKIALHKKKKGVPAASKQAEGSAKKETPVQEIKEEVKAEEVKVEETKPEEIKKEEVEVEEKKEEPKEEKKEE